MKRVVLLLLVGLATAAWAGYPEKDRVREAGAGQDILERTPHGVVRMPVRSLDDEGGTAGSEWMYVGSTDYDYQTLGSPERLIAVGPNSEIHFVWMSNVHDFRDVRYNCIEAGGDSLFSSEGYYVGIVVSRFPDLAIGPYGNAFIGVHANPAEEMYHPFLVPEFGSCSGAMNETWGVSYDQPCNDRLWPRIDLDNEGRVHLVASDAEPCNSGYYTRVTPNYEDSLFVSLDNDIAISQFATNCTRSTIEIACARNSGRVAVAWIDSPSGFDNPENILMRVSEDNGENWSEVTSITDLPPIDTMCVINGGSPEECNGDTLRPFHDLSMIFDDNDNLHIAFSASGYYYFNSEGVADPARLILSNIWHWSEETDDFSLIGEAWFGNDSVGLGANNLMCQKPSLAIDTTTGYLYCAYQQFDRHAYSAEGYPIGEFYMSVSTDNGGNWAVPTNVSNTPGVPNNPSGDDPSERDISLAKFATNDQIHALYLHDYSAGSTPYDEGLVVPCSLVYMRIPTLDIPTTPLNPQRQFRDSTSGVGDVVELPSEFELYPNFPNPFNPSTTLQFVLAKAGDVRLTVFDVLGKEVAMLVDGRMSAGVHSVEFDGEKFASGVYFARLSTGNLAMTRKMVLLK